MAFEKIIKETEKLIALEKGKTTRRNQLLNRLKVLKALQTEAKTIKGAEDIEKLILKKDKFGRPFFSDYQEKLKALKDLQSNKYTDPKTNKVFTPKEWLSPTKPDGTKYSEASIGAFRNKFRDPDTFKEKKAEYQKGYMAKKKKDPSYRAKFKEAKTKEYFKDIDKKLKIDKGAGKAVLQLQDNKLLAYLLTAAKKQKKNLKGNDTPRFEEVTKNKKFAGVKDNKTGITYHHSRYKGPLGPMDKLINDHPQFNRTKELTKIADGFKRSLPNDTIASYFAKYDRVPTNAELYNFLSKDPKFVNQYSKQAMSSNSLELHHRLGVEVAPDKSLQLTPRVKNNTAGVIVEEFKKGNISKTEAEKQLKKINVRVKLPGTKAYVGAKDVSPTQAVGAAKREVSRMFFDSVKKNPQLVNQIAETFALKAKQVPGACQIILTKALGGSIDSCVETIKKDPVGSAEKINNIKTNNKSIQELKGVAQRVLNVLPKTGTVGKVAVGTAGVGLALSGLRFNPEKGEIVTTNNDQKADQNQILQYVKDNPLKVAAGTSLGFAAEEIPGAYRTARGVGERGPLPKGRGKVRSALGISGALRPVLTTFGTPLVTGLFEGAVAGKRLDEGETMTDVLTDPLGPALGLSLMEPLSKMSGVIKDAKPLGIMGGLKRAINPFDFSNVGVARAGLTSKILRMGLAPIAIAGMSKAGLIALAAATAATAGKFGYDQYNKYQNEEGMIYNLFND